MKNYEHIKTEIRSSNLIIYLSRPEKMNAFTELMMRELIDVMNFAEEETDIRAIIFTGEGKKYCAGADLSTGEDSFNWTDKKKEAKLIHEKIKNKTFEIKKLSTENKELYGSVKPTEISKIIYETSKIEIKPSMIQPIKEIKSIGKFKVKISLHSEVEAEIMIIVNSSETIQ